MSKILNIPVKISAYIPGILDALLLKLFYLLLALVLIFSRLLAHYNFVLGIYTSGVEVAIHSMSTVFLRSSTVLLRSLRPYMGVAISSRASVEDYVSSKVASWITELELLASFAVTQPHAAFSAFSHGVISK